LCRDLVYTKVGKFPGFGWKYFVEIEKRLEVGSLELEVRR
jgi:hypothetical protein